MRGIGDSHIPVAPAYSRGKEEIGKTLGDDLKLLFWLLRDYASKEMPLDSSKQWVFCGHSLGTLLSIHASVFTHVRKLVLLDPPLFPLAEATKWAIACRLGKRHTHPLAQMTRRRKRTFRNCEQATWVFSKVEFFRGWPLERLQDYVDSNYKSEGLGLTLRHNPMWEADIIESQPASSTLALLSLPREARLDMQLKTVFGAQSPFHCIESILLLRSAFNQPEIHSLENSAHMLVFQKEEALLKLFKEKILTPEFLQPPILVDKKLVTAF